MNRADIEWYFVDRIHDGTYRVLDDGRGTIERRQPDGSYRRVRPDASTGYVRLRGIIDGRRVTASGHRVIWAWAMAEAVPEHLQIDHRDGDRANNDLGNLRVVTPRENIRAAVRDRGVHVGERNPAARLEVGDVLDIRESLARGESRQTLADRYSVTVECIRLLGLGRRWQRLLEALGCGGPVGVAA